MWHWGPLASLDEAQASAEIQGSRQALMAITGEPVAGPETLRADELAKNRIDAGAEVAAARHAGVPLVLWISGGIRSGKSFICALLVVCHWLHMRVKRLGNKRAGADVYCMTSRLMPPPPA